MLSIRMRFPSPLSLSLSFHIFSPTTFGSEQFVMLPREATQSPARLIHLKNISSVSAAESPVGRSKFCAFN